MPYYRGVEQNDVIYSITDAADFLLALDIGPECNKMIAPFTSDSDAIKKLFAAETDDQFIHDLHNTGASSAFTYLTEALLYHAHLDTDGAARDIAINLSKWGALEGARDMALHVSDTEIEKHIETLPEIEDIYAPIPGMKGAFGRFGVVLRDSDSVDKNDLVEHFKKLNDDVIKDIVESYFSKGEVHGFGVGSVGPLDMEDLENNAFGSMVMCTRNVAEIIAAELDDSYKVIDEDGEEVLPKQSLYKHADAVKERRMAASEHDGPAIS